MQSKDHYSSKWQPLLLFLSLILHGVLADQLFVYCLIHRYRGATSPLENEAEISSVPLHVSKFYKSVPGLTP